MTITRQIFEILLKYLNFAKVILIYVINIIIPNAISWYWYVDFSGRKFSGSCWGDPIGAIFFVSLGVIALAVALTYSVLVVIIRREHYVWASIYLALCNNMAIIIIIKIFSHAIY